MKIDPPELVQLKTPHQGERFVYLMEKTDNKCFVRILCSDKIFEVDEAELIFD